MSGEVKSTTLKASPEQYLDYQPIEPEVVDTVEWYDKGVGKKVEILWDSLTNDQKRVMLPNQTALVSVASQSANAKLEYLVASVSGDAGAYVVVLDFMKFKVENIFDENDMYLGTGKVGVGLRIKATVVTAEAKLNLGSLLALGVAAEAKKLDGTLSVEVIGIDSAKVTDLLPMGVTISQASIQNSLQALASIKPYLWEKETTITPQLIWFRQARANALDDMRTGNIKMEPPK
jgi:hypothetical protein